MEVEAESTSFTKKLVICPIIKIRSWVLPSHWLLPSLSSLPSWPLVLGEELFSPADTPEAPGYNTKCKHYLQSLEGDPRPLSLEDQYSRPQLQSSFEPSLTSQKQAIMEEIKTSQVPGNLATDSGGSVILLAKLGGGTKIAKALTVAARKKETFAVLLKS